MLNAVLLGEARPVSLPVSPQRSGDNNAEVTFILHESQKVYSSVVTI